MLKQLSRVRSRYLFWREEGRVLEAAVSESESMVMEVVSAAVSGSEVAGNWMRMV